MARINMINCDTCNKRCDNLKDSYFQVNRYDAINEEFIEEALNEENAYDIKEIEDYEKHFCSLECLKKHYTNNNKMEEALKYYQKEFKKDLNRERKKRNIKLFNK